MQKSSRLWGGDRSAQATAAAWPELPFAEWNETRQTLHRWIQLVGKIRLSKSPWINHSWQTPLYLTSRGLTTSVIRDGNRSFSIVFDFVSHCLVIETSEGRRCAFALRPMSVASFHDELFSALSNVGIQVRIHELPNELSDATPFFSDMAHHSYDGKPVQRFWRTLLSIEYVMERFRSRFIGKVSPIHLFWGSLDLAVTRFSGRRAPEHPGGIPHLPDIVTREAYSHEVSSCGFWPGDDRHPEAAFYSYAYPTPEGFAKQKILPDAAYWDETLREFILPYDVVRLSNDPSKTLIEFFQSTYEAAARLGGWNRDDLEHSPYLEELQRKHA